jgi:hypothetical protein
MKSELWHGLVLATIAVGVLLLPGVAAAVPLAAASHAGLSASITKYTNYNWTGYYASGANASATKVTGVWVEPTTKCTSATTQWAAFGVAIGGRISSSSPTLEEIGTLGRCVNGTVAYSAWWDLYPASAVHISNITVHPGDKITASVTFASGKFTISLKDGKQRFSTKKTQSGALRSAAGCLVSGGRTNGVQLADFGVVKFSKCTATIGGHTGGIGTFATVYEATMVSQKPSHAALSVPSKLGATKSSFSVTWKRAY